MSELSRRQVLAAGAAGLVGLVAVSAFGAGKVKAPEVEPNEDLMREHGALRRMLLIYEEVARRTAAGRPPLAQLAATSGLIKRFVEDYHEKLEENYVFPTFEKAKKLTDLTAVLRQQHEAGRKITTQLHALATGHRNDAAVRREIGQLIVAFVRMYQPHAAGGHGAVPAIPGRRRGRAATESMATCSRTKSTSSSARLGSRGSSSRSRGLRNSWRSITWRSLRRGWGPPRRTPESPAEDLPISLQLGLPHAGDLCEGGAASSAARGPFRAGRCRGR